jgi:hypothetical protein
MDDLVGVRSLFGSFLMGAKINKPKEGPAEFHR